MPYKYACKNLGSSFFGDRIAEELRITLSLNLMGLALMRIWGCCTREALVGVKVLISGSIMESNAAYLLLWAV